MKCEKCENKAIIGNPILCSEHFEEYILKTVQDTITQFNLFTKETKICVAVSGGKDSLALIDILIRLGYSVEGLFVNEGISNYREYSNEDLEKFMRKNKLLLRTTSFQDLVGHSLDEIMNTEKFHACSVCGTLRRYLLNKFSKEYDVIATGHNLDDEAQTVLINLARGNTDLMFRGGPKSKPTNQFTQKVKPLIFVSEKQLLTYAIIRKIKTGFEECPYAQTSYRAHLRDLLNEEESKNPSTKLNILKSYLNLEKNIIKCDVKEKELCVCSVCGEASQEGICKACKLKEEIINLLH
ncbi:TIGR00269 family protein [Candidatus Woesearchaeota archaeon]|nr:TIGR00269 family protein [Candidatus Woesearchaeota archaeon]